MRSDYAKCVVVGRSVIQTHIKENIKAPRHRPLHGAFTGEFPAQMASNAENVSIWWCRHACKTNIMAAIPWLLMTWWWTELRSQQACYWPSFLGLSGFSTTIIKYLLKDFCKQTYGQKQTQGPVSKSDKMSYRKISWSLEATRLVHYNDVTMDAIASQITSLMTIYSTIYSDADQRKHQSSASLAYVRGIHHWPVNSLHKWPVMRKKVSIWWRRHGLNCRIAFRFDRHIGSSAAEVPGKFQNETIIQNTNLAASRLHEILREDILSDIEMGPRIPWIHLSICWSSLLASLVLHIHVHAYSCPDKPYILALIYTSRSPFTNMD